MKSILLQAGIPEVVAYIFVLLICIGLFFALRGVILWYYKLDVISKNLTEQTRLLEEILNRLDQKPNE